MRKSGFTLIELMLVVIIIGVLAAVAIPRITGKSEKARLTAARASIESITTMLDNFNMDVGRYPTTAEGLEALYQKPASLPDDSGWDGPYTRKRYQRDSWGREFVYRCPPEQGIDFDLISLGPDGREGTADDIVNFEQE